MSQERAFVESVCNQRFNFFIVFFAATIAGVASAKTRFHQTAILLTGTTVAVLMYFGLIRTYQRLWEIIDYIREDSTHPEKIITQRLRQRGRILRFSARPIYSYIIPGVCLAVLLAALVLSIRSDLPMNPG
jgi:hypothetical protein